MQNRNLFNAQVGDHVYFGRYQGEQIEWRVLAERGQRKLLITEYGIDAKPYNEPFKSVTWETWETCSLRRWLNGAFYDMAFNAEEKGMIVTVINTNSNNPEYKTNGGNSTDDKVALLSIDEAKTYFKNVQDRQCRPTAYAKRQGAYVNDNGYCWWWLRSPILFLSRNVFYILADGKLYFNYAYSAHSVVRPALWINL